MKTDSEICHVFDVVIRRLAAHGVDLNVNGAFVLSSRDEQIATIDTVDGLTAFADALDFAKVQAAELETLCAEAYQVIGALASEAVRGDDPAVEKVLDNLSELRLVHEDVLPFESACPAPDTLPAP